MPSRKRLRYTPQSRISDSFYTDTMFSNDFTPSLNDIRFSGWTEEDWCDNDYIKALRVYLDEFQAGRIEDEELAPYKDKINCQFVVGYIGQFLGGGAFIDIIFLDLPNRVFSSWVYSYVDEETNVITGYEVRSVTINEELIENTREEILKVTLLLNLFPLISKEKIPKSSLQQTSYIIFA